MSGSRTWAESRSDGVDWALTLNTDEFPTDQNFVDLCINQHNWVARHESNFVKLMHEDLTDAASTWVMGNVTTNGEIRK